MKEIHTIQDRLEGINEMCTLSQKEIKNCQGYGAVGDRACNNKFLPDFEEGDIPSQICKYYKLKI